MAGETSFPASMGKLAPWCYRVLTPFLASLLPFDTMASFRILAFITNVLSIFFLYFMLDHFRFSITTRILGILLYAGTFWTLKFSFFSPSYIDYLTQFFLILIIFLTLRKMYIPLIFVFLVAGLQKESLAAFSVFSIIHFLRHGKTSHIWTKIIISLLLFAAPFTTALIVRSIVQPINTYSPTVLFSFFNQATSIRSFVAILIQASFSGLGIIPIILACQLSVLDTLYLQILGMGDLRAHFTCFSFRGM